MPRIVERQDDDLVMSQFSGSTPNPANTGGLSNDAVDDPSPNAGGTTATPTNTRSPDTNDLQTHTTSGSTPNTYFTFPPDVLHSTGTQTSSQIQTTGRLNEDDGSSPSSGFLSNREAVAGVFSAIAIILLCLIFAAWFFLYRRTPNSKTKHAASPSAVSSFFAGTSSAAGLLRLNSDASARRAHTRTPLPYGVTEKEMEKGAAASGEKGDAEKKEVAGDTWNSRWSTLSFTNLLNDVDNSFNPPAEPAPASTKTTSMRYSSNSGSSPSSLTSSVLNNLPPVGYGRTSQYGYGRNSQYRDEYQSVSPTSPPMTSTTASFASNSVGRGSHYVRTTDRLASQSIYSQTQTEWSSTDSESERARRERERPAAPRGKYPTPPSTGSSVSLANNSHALLNTIPKFDIGSMRGHGVGLGGAGMASTATFGTDHLKNPFISPDDNDSSSSGHGSEYHHYYDGAEEGKMTNLIIDGAKNAIRGTQDEDQIISPTTTRVVSSMISASSNGSASLVGGTGWQPGYGNRTSDTGDKLLARVDRGDNASLREDRPNSNLSNPFSDIDDLIGDGLIRWPDPPMSPSAVHGRTGFL